MSQIGKRHSRKTETSKQQSFAYSADNLTWDLHREVCEAHLQAMPSSDEHPHPYTPHETNGAHMEHYRLPPPIVNAPKHTHIGRNGVGL